MQSSTMSPLMIEIISSQGLVRLGLQKILGSSTSMKMVVLPYQGRKPDRLLAERQADLFILDLETEHDALGTINQLRESAPASKIVLLCGLEDRDRSQEALASGVDGVILKIQPPEVVLAVIEALYAPEKSHVHMERDSTGGIGSETSFTKKAESDSRSPAWPEALTEREREIIRLVGQGLSNKDIAYKLSISDSTVRHHMTSIFDKVGVPNRQKLLLHTHHNRSSPV